MRISMIGAGHVGLVSGACLAARGHEVVCVDADRARVDAINQGAVPFLEPGLGEMITYKVGENLMATTDLREAIFTTEVSIIAWWSGPAGIRITSSWRR